MSVWRRRGGVLVGTGLGIEILDIDFKTSGAQYDRFIVRAGGSRIPRSDTTPRMTGWTAAAIFALPNISRWMDWASYPSLTRWYRRRLRDILPPQRSVSG